MIHTWHDLGPRCGAGTNHLGPQHHGKRTANLRYDTMTDEDMKDEYDFSKGEHGKLFRPSARVHLPVSLKKAFSVRWRISLNVKAFPWMI